METSKRPLKRLPQVTLWELQRHTITVRNPLAWDKTSSDKPIQRDIVDLSELCLHRAGEGLRPLFDRNDVLINQDGMEERTMRVQRSRSTSSSSSSDSSESERSRSKPVATGTSYPKRLRFTCEKNSRKKSPEQSQKDQRLSEDRHRSVEMKRKRGRKTRSPYRKQSVSPYRKQHRGDSSRSPERSRGSPSTSRRSPVKHSGPSLARKSPMHSRLGKSPNRQRKSPPRPNRRSPRRSSRSPGRSRGKSRDNRRRSQSPRVSSRLRRDSPERPRHWEFSKGRRSPERRREYSSRRDEGESSFHGKNLEQIPQIDYTHLAHVITQMYPRQPFIPPHVIPQPSEFFPHYGIPPVPLPPRPRFPTRPPIVYNNRTIKIFKPMETTSGTTNVTTTVTSASSAQLTSTTTSSAATTTSDETGDKPTLT